MISRLRAVAAATALGIALSACSGSQQGNVTPSVSPGSGPPANGQHMTSATFSIAIPKKKSKFAKRGPDYISPNIQSAALVVTPNGKSALPTDKFNCTYTCTTTLQIPTGTDTFAVTVYDQTNQGGKKLATGSTTQQINPNVQNNVTVTFNPVLASASLSLTSSFTSISSLPYLPISGSSNTASLIVTAYDSDQNIIVGPGNYLNSSLQPVSLTIADSDTSARTALSTSTLTGGDVNGTSNGSNLVTVTFNGAVPRSVWPTFSLTATGYANSALGAPVTLQYGPTASASYSVTTAALSSSQPYAFLSPGPSSTIWYANQTSNSSPEGIIGKLTISSGAITEYPLPNGNYYPQALTNGPDGNMWFTETNAVSLPSKIAKITPTGTVTEYKISGVPEPGALVTGADGNLWFAEVGSATNSSAAVIGKITPSGTLTEYTVPNGEVFNSYAPILVNGPGDGKIWFAYYGSGGSEIRNITTSSGAFAKLSTSTALPSPIYTFVLAADNNFWFNGSSNVSPTSGTISTYSCLYNGSQPEAVGADGLLWGYGPSILATINPTTHACRPEGYDTYGTNSPGFQYQFILGPDSNFWTYNGTTIGKYLY
jgi:virginiamycin B lyase